MHLPNVAFATDNPKEFQNYVLNFGCVQLPKEYRHPIYLVENLTEILTSLLHSPDFDNLHRLLGASCHKKADQFITCTDHYFLYSYLRHDSLFSLPVEWGRSYYGHTNWDHNFNKLEFLCNIPLITARELLRDYLIYNKCNCNPWSKNDHTVCQRLYSLMQLKCNFESMHDKEGTALCLELIDDCIETLLRKDIYSQGTNHGLMSDIALLTAWKEGLFSSADINSVFSRGIATYKAMFSENGISLEHSVCYQEWNCMYGKIFLDLLSLKPEYTKDAQQMLSNLLNSSARLLGAMTTGDDLYFAMGDSDRKPRATCLQFLDETILKKARVQQGVQVFPEGFYVYRDIPSGTHLAFTCQRHSGMHKVDDELAFCLWMKNTSLIEEPGSPWGAPQNGFRFSQCVTHSTVRLMGYPWLPRLDTPKDPRSCLTPLTTENNTIKFGGSHERIRGFRINRSFQISHTNAGNVDITVEDHIEKLSEDDLDFPQAIHRFILSPGITTSKNGDRIILSKNERPICAITVIDEIEWVYYQRKTGFIGVEATDLIVTNCLDIISDSPIMKLLFSALFE